MDNLAESSKQTFRPIIPLEVAHHYCDPPSPAGIGSKSVHILVAPDRSHFFLLGAGLLPQRVSGSLWGVPMLKSTALNGLQTFYHHLETSPKQAPSDHKKTSEDHFKKSEALFNHFNFLDLNTNDGSELGEFLES